MPICSKCQQDKPDREYTHDGYLRKTGQYGLRKQCRACRSAINKAWRAAHKAEYTFYNQVTRKARKVKPVPALPTDDKAIPQHVIVPPNTETQTKESKQ